MVLENCLTLPVVLLCQTGVVLWNRLPRTRPWFCYTNTALVLENHPARPRTWFFYTTTPGLSEPFSMPSRAVFLHHMVVVLQNHSLPPCAWFRYPNRDLAPLHTPLIHWDCFLSLCITGSHRLPSFQTLTTLLPSTTLGNLFSQP